jgi:hypothetical protein
MMRAWWLWLVGCSHAALVPPSPDAGCSTLVDVGSPVAITCPAMTVCPDCPEHTGLGGAIVAGTYVLIHDDVWSSACGSLAGQSESATLRIDDRSLELAAHGAVTRYTYTPQTSIDLNGVMQWSLELTPACPRGVPTALRYTASGEQLVFEAMPSLSGTVAFQRQ